MKKPLTILISVASAIIITASCTVPLTIFIYNKIGNNVEYSKIKEIDKNISDNFLYKIDKEKFNDAIAEGIIKGLNDDYATYYNPNQLVEKHEQSEGIRTESGIKYTRDPNNNLLYVYFISDLSPASKSGIKKGDRIVKIFEQNVKNMSDEEINAAMNGAVGTEIYLDILREDKIFSVKFKFSQFEIDSVKWRKIDDIGYIQITHFDGATPKQFKNAIEKLNKLSIKGLVFDLRNNLGGSVSSVVEILDMLMPKGPLVTVKYKDGTTKITDNSDESEINLPMSVIMNQNTASASEIFTMNIRDYNKGKLIGTRSYGKGIIQVTYELSDKTAVKFTVAEIVNKKKEAYHNKGFTPDIEVELSETENKYFYMLSDKEDPQIKAAIEAVTKIG